MSKIPYQVGPYTLHAAEVQLRSGKSQRILFFRRTEDHTTLPGHQVKEPQPRNEIPIEWQIAAAQELQRSGYSADPHQAAEIIGRLSGQKQGLAPHETEEAIQQIHLALTDD
jgi:hypothetical protein